MKRSILAVIGILLALGFASTANAQDRDRMNNQNAQNRNRARNQQARIRQGIKSGTITRDEARHLRIDQQGIRRVRRENAESGHRPTAAQRARINRLRNQQSRRIYRLKHNDRNR